MWCGFCFLLGLCRATCVMTQGRDEPPSICLSFFLPVSAFKCLFLLPCLSHVTPTPPQEFGASLLAVALCVTWLEDFSVSSTTTLLTSAGMWEFYS